VLQPIAEPIARLAARVGGGLLLALAMNVTWGQTGNAADQVVPERLAFLHAPRDRLTDERILSDRQTIQRLQNRLERLNTERQLPIRSYPYAKAQCWLDSAKSQYHENDRTGYVEEALAESHRIMTALEQGQTDLGRETPLIARASRLREDLWNQFDRLKQAPGFACAAQTIACGEVRLVRGGHANSQTGWRAANPFIAMAEDAVAKANREVAACDTQVAARGPVAIGSGATTSTAAPERAHPIPTKETFVLLADTLFRFDRSAASDILPGGLQRLGQIVERLKQYRTIETLSIVGHTDRLGTDEYNDRLSAERASTIKIQLESMGLRVGKVTVEGRGKRQPVTNLASCPDQSRNDALIQCLQADRRVEIEVTGVAR
jgi:outer membrane protein OmpA-like peptidoglycan-associated protein